MRFQGFLEGKISTLEGMRLTMTDTATLNAYKEMRNYLNRIIEEENKRLPPVRRGVISEEGQREIERNIGLGRKDAKKSFEEIVEKQ